MYVDEVALRDFRAIASSRVSLTHPLTDDGAREAPSNLNLVIGTNGSGKSSVLKAIAATFAVAGDIALPASAGGWPRIGGSGEAEVQLRTSSPSDTGPRLGQMTLRLPGNERDPSGQRPAVFAAYGPQRIADTPADTLAGAEPDGQPPTGIHLLDARTPLTSLAGWLPHAHRPDEVAHIVNSLLPDDVRCRARPNRDGHLLVQRGIALPSAALSDGIQSFLAWVGDLLHRLDDAAAGSDELADVAGLVLVDEIDQRLHPSWQRSILNRLGTAFPALQFVCTAHSPLLLSGLRRQNLLLVEPDRERGTGATAVRRLAVEDVYGYSTDQILESAYYGLSSSRSDPFWTELRALARRAQDSTASTDSPEGSNGPDAALEFMNRLATPAHQPGTAPAPAPDDDTS